MRKLIQIGFMLCVVLSAAAQEPPVQKVLRVYDWKDLQQQYPIPDSEIVSMDGMSVLKIQNQSTNHLIIPQISLLTITDSAIIKKAAFISMEFKCADLWEFTNTDYNRRFDNDSRIYQLDVADRQAFRPGFHPQLHGNSWDSASLSLYQTIPPYAPGGDEHTNVAYGHLGLAGTMNWAREDLNIDRSQIAGLPNQLELKLIYVPAHGTIYLRPIKLIGVAGTWWSPQMGAQVGGISGSLIGCLGALIGILASLGKARRFVLTTTVLLIVVGILLVIIGIIAVASEQPYAVWYPLLLGGAILTFVLSINLYSIKRRYDDLEIRRMTSMDATGR